MAPETLCLPSRGNSTFPPPSRKWWPSPGHIRLGKWQRERDSTENQASSRKSQGRLWNYNKHRNQSALLYMAAVESNRKVKCVIDDNLFLFELCFPMLFIMKITVRFGQEYQWIKISFCVRLTLVNELLVTMGSQQTKWAWNRFLC